VEQGLERVRRPVGARPNDLRGRVEALDSAADRYLQQERVTRYPGGVRPGLGGLGGPHSSQRAQLAALQAGPVFPVRQASPAVELRLKQ
jgi:hypothetical protein